MRVKIGFFVILGECYLSNIHNYYEGQHNICLMSRSHLSQYQHKNMCKNRQVVLKVEGLPTTNKIIANGAG